MNRKTNKLISQEGKKDYGEKAVEETKIISQGDDEFDSADNEFEEALAEENAFLRACAEKSAARAPLQRERNMTRYATVTANDPEEEEEEENLEGNCKQPATNPSEGSCGWEK